MRSGTELSTGVLAELVPLLCRIQVRLCVGGGWDDGVQHILWLDHVLGRDWHSEFCARPPCCRNVVEGTMGAKYTIFWGMQSCHQAHGVSGRPFLTSVDMVVERNGAGLTDVQTHV